MTLSVYVLNLCKVILHKMYFDKKNSASILIKYFSGNTKKIVEDPKKNSIGPWHSGYSKRLKNERSGF